MTDIQLVDVRRTPGSVLANESASAESRFFIGRRPRLATCSGVAWFHGLHLATLNLLGNAVHTYRFDPATKSLAPLQTRVQLRGLAQPENLAFSPDGELLAVTNSVGASVNIYCVDVGTHAISPRPLVAVNSAEWRSPHGVSFLPGADVLCFSTVDNPGSLRLFQIVRNDPGSIALSPMQTLLNGFAPLKPKGMAFSPDGRFLSITYSLNAKLQSHRARTGFVATYAFDIERGCSSDPVSVSKKRFGLRSAEDVNFFPDGTHMVVTDQGSDSAMVFAFDASTGAIGDRTTAIENPWARLSFPHGNAVSPDGRFLAIANYGDDKLTMYEINPGALVSG